MEYKHKNRGNIRHIISAPFIWAVLFPALFLDICTEIYHHICFRLYGIPLIKRSEYIRIDRQHLSYLSGIEKINCMYCGYMNGLANYWAQIVGATELYWCAIKHSQDNNFQDPPHHKNFLKYGDEKGFRKKYK